jgi:very-short-patch-repair endonuclease
VISRAQLLALGFTRAAIAQRLANGRLHVLFRGVYAVGRPDVTRHGWWMAAVLACGPGTVLSDSSAAALWGIGPDRPGRIEVSVPTDTPHRRPGIVVHRRKRLDTTKEQQIPVTTVAATLSALASRLDAAAIERAINEADKRNLITPTKLRAAIDGNPHAAALRRVLDRRTFVLTDSELERRFVPIARAAGLPRPQTGVHLNGFKVDFYWPQFGLVVETDGLRYHRTPAAQARDRRRDQAHTAAGLNALRFTHEQIRYEPDHVRATLAAVAAQAFTPRRRNKPR